MPAILGEGVRTLSESTGGPPRKTSEHASLLGPLPLGHNTPTKLRIAKEQDLEKEFVGDVDSAGDSRYSFYSLQDTISQGQDSGRRRSTLKPLLQPRTRDSSRENTGVSPLDDATVSPSRLTPAGSSPHSLSASPRSLSLDSQAPLSSLPSTPKSISNRSFRPHDEESTGDTESQAIASSEDDENKSSIVAPESTPQLVMPSIKMPSRRPFTERGRAMGRFKMLIAGDSGVGKTNLIKSIVQTCEDIVHVDPFHLNSTTVNDLLSERKSKMGAKPAQPITEVFASTKPYPSWWSDIGNPKTLPRPRTMGDAVLERNICFVDTQGYGSGLSRIENMDIILQYIEAQLTKPFTASTASEGDIIGLLSGVGGSQVDVVFYLLSQEFKDEDLIFLQRLTAMTNVIPLIAKSDLQSAEEIEMMKRSIDRLLHLDIRLFSLKKDPSRSLPSEPYTVCSAIADDDDNMDASLLMSSGYVQPLVPSELQTLVHQVFDPENIACMKHLAAKKLVHAQGSRIFSVPTSIQSTLPQLDHHHTANSQTQLPSTISRRNMTPHTSYFSPYVQAKISHHTQKEEKLAQIRLAKWAGDLQRSLQNERLRYEAIARGERASWLSERLDVVKRENALQAPLFTTAQPENSEIAGFGELKGKLDCHSMLHAGDPLGILTWSEIAKSRGWLALQVVGVIGSFGVLGAMAAWIVRTYGHGSNFLLSWNWSSLALSA